MIGTGHGKAAGGARSLGPTACADEERTGTGRGGRRLFTDTDGVLPTDGVSPPRQGPPPGQGFSRRTPWVHPPVGVLPYAASLPGAWTITVS